MYDRWYLATLTWLLFMKCWNSWRAKINHCRSRLCSWHNNENKSLIFSIVYEVAAITRKLSSHFVWHSITIRNVFLWYGPASVIYVKFNYGHVVKMLWMKWCSWRWILIDLINIAVVRFLLSFIVELRLTNMTVNQSFFLTTPGWVWLILLRSELYFGMINLVPQNTHLSIRLNCVLNLW